MLVIARHGGDRGRSPSISTQATGIGAVAHEIAETDDPDGALAGGIGEHGGQRFEIAVDVGQDGVADGGPWIGTGTSWAADALCARGRECR